MGDIFDDNNSNDQSNKKLDGLDDLDDNVYFDENKEDDEANQDDGSISMDNFDDNEPDYEDDESEDYNQDSKSDDDDEKNDDEEDEENGLDNDGSIIVNINGSDIKLKDIDELQEVTKSAIKGDTKYKQHKDSIAVLEGIKEEGVSDEDLYLLVEAKKGNKQALAKLISDSGVDIDDIDDTDPTGYKPSEYKADPNYIETKAILTDLQSDESVYNQFENLLLKDFDEASRKEVFENPKILEFVGETIKAGLFEKIAPNYMKNKLLGKSNSIEAYISAYDEYSKELKESSENTRKNHKEQIEDKSKDKATKRKKVSDGSRKRTPRGKKKNVEDMSDTEFEKYYKSIVGEF